MNTFAKLSKITILGLLCLSLISCGNESSNKNSNPTSSDKPSLTPAKKQTADHQDKRLAFEKIKVATSQNQFKGGTTLQELKELYGEPSKHESKPAGNVNLDNYTWNFDQVTIHVNLFQDSTVVKNIQNFAFVREPFISLKDYQKLKKGMTYSEVTKIIAEPDDYTTASSTDVVQVQAIWLSGLKTNSGNANIQLLFENDKLTKISQQGLISSSQ